MTHDFLKHPYLAFFLHFQEEISVEDVIEVQRHLRRKPSSRRRRRRDEFLDRGSQIDRVSFILFPTVS